MERQVKSVKVSEQLITQCNGRTNGSSYTARSYIVEFVDGQVVRFPSDKKISRATAIEFARSLASQVG